MTEDSIFSVTDCRAVWCTLSCTNNPGLTATRRQDPTNRTRWRAGCKLGFKPRYILYVLIYSVLVYLCICSFVPETSHLPFLVEQTDTARNFGSVLGIDHRSFQARFWECLLDYLIYWFVDFVFVMTAMHTAVHTQTAGNKRHSRRQGPSLLTSRRAILSSGL